MAWLGDKVKINEKGLSSPRKQFGVLNMGSNEPDTDFAEVAGRIGRIIGFNGGHSYGDGMYDPALVIVHFEVDGKLVAKRVPEEYIDVVESAPRYK